MRYVRVLYLWKIGDLGIIGNEKCMISDEKKLRD